MVSTRVEVPMTRKGYEKIKVQIFASLVGNIILLGHGCTVGWLSPALPILQSENGPLLTGPINLSETSWVGSMVAIGAAAGTIAFGILSNYVGSKAALVWCSIPIMVRYILLSGVDVCADISIHWIMIKFLKYVWQICIARFLAGLTGGGVFICIPLFIAEIANEHVRGSLASILTVNFNTGILLGLILGSIVDYGMYPLLVMIFPTIFFSLFIFFPNTPQYLLKCNRIEDAEKSLKFYRNFNPHSKQDCDDFVMEFDKFKAIAEQNKLSEGLKISDLYEPSARKGITIGIILMAVNGFSGAFTLINYASIIFKESGSNIDANTSAITLGTLQICGTLCTIAIIDRFGRKILMLISTAGVAFSLSVMGVYSYLSKHGYDLTDYNLVPVISLSLVIFLSAIGITPVPYVLVAEILPQKARRAGATICITSVSIFAFIMLKVFPLLLNIVELYGCMAIFTTVALFGLLFTIFVIKETKGKNLDTLECRK